MSYTVLTEEERKKLRIQLVKLNAAIIDYWKDKSGEFIAEKINIQQTYIGEELKTFSKKMLHIKASLRILGVADENEPFEKSSRFV